MYRVTLPGRYTIISLVYLYNVHRYSVVHISINSYKNIYISIFIYWVKFTPNIYICSDI
jgi:hypothetical protein